MTEEEKDQESDEEVVEYVKTRIKPTKAEHERRVGLVYDLLLMGFKAESIGRYLSEKKKIDVTQRTVERYITQATSRILEAAKTNRDLELGKARDRLDHLYQRNIAIQDFKAALAVVRETSALLGLNAPTKTETSLKNAEDTVLKVIYERKESPGNAGINNKAAGTTPEADRIPPEPGQAEDN